MSAPPHGVSVLRGALARGAPGILLRVFLLGGFLLASPGMCWGEGQEEPAARERAVDRIHGYVGAAVEELARRFDRFFGGEITYEEATGSYLQVGGSAIWEEGGRWDFDHRILLKMVLPQAQKRLRLVVESDQEDQVSGGAGKSEAELAPTTTSEKRRALIGLENRLQETLNWKVSLTGGIKLPLPPDPFVRLRGRWRKPFGSWQLRATETVFWFRSEGFGETTAFDFDRRVSSAVLFRASSEATFLLDESGFDLTQGLNFYQNLSRIDALTYRYAVFGETNPRTRTTGHVVSLRYRRQIYGEWLFFEIEPGVRYERENNFGPSPFLAVRIDAIARGG